MPHTRSPPYRRRLRWPFGLLPGALVFFALVSPIRALEKSAADYFVRSLPGAPEPLLRMYAGHIEITPEHHGNMFFWLFQNRHIDARRKTVIWLNGGPGCSSMDGALMEIGPYRVNEDGTLRYNRGRWDEFANILFVDNPVGTGFSYIDGDSYVHELDEMAAQMIAFLEKWFAIFPEYMYDDLYIAGESYAGQHIPYIARAVLDRNAKNEANTQWNVKGLLIGNGWISGPEQYMSYIPFAYETGILQAGSAQDQNAQAQQKQCIQALDRGGKDHVDTMTCELILQGLNRELGGTSSCFNVYDVRLKDTYPSCGMSWPPDLVQVKPYLRREDVIRALNINPDKKTGWQECNGQVGSAFNARNSQPSKVLLPGLLEQMPIILFSGDKDLICNHIGTENLIANLEWNGAIGMDSSATQRAWTFNDEPAGLYQDSRNLTYIRFYNSSHMVPFDYPMRTQDMLHRFMGVKRNADSFIEGETPNNSNNNNNNNNNNPATTASPSSNPSSFPTTTPQESQIAAAATWTAYRRSGEAALVVVILVALAWGFFVFRDRRKRRGYRGVFSSEPYDDVDRDGQVAQRRDVEAEAAAPYDERELDELTEQGGRFGLDDDEEDSEDDVGKGRASGNGKR